MSGDATSGMAATKLRPPAPPARLVHRPELDDLLAGAIERRVPLVLTSAPAGSGKSTLLAAWADGLDVEAAWLQVEDSDSDPARFWSALVSAIGRVRPGFAAAVAPVALGSAGDDHVVVPAIVNALVDRDERLVVVVDDYHLIEAGSVHRGLERLIDLCPPQLTIVLSTRVDPPFRLGRLRVRDRIAEIRADDLRFGPHDAAPLLGAVGATLQPGVLETLCERTEGWAAGLVLAGISMERSDDPTGFVDAFRGDDQLVVSYLGDELLTAMSDHDRRLLLETSVLDRLSGSLVDAVTGTTGGGAWLAAIADRNQLVVRLDSTGEWFRYHHLLRDLLALEAGRAYPERLPVLHCRAAEWFESRGDHGRAVVHRLAGGDVTAAMGLMRVVGPDLLGTGQVRTLRALLGEIGERAATDTVCSLAWGWCDYLSGRYTTAQEWLDRALDVAPEGFDRTITVPLSINVSLGRGDVGRALELAREVTAAGDLATRPSELATAVGAAYLWAGQSAAARDALALALPRSVIEHRLTARVLALVYLAIAAVEDGDLPAARAAAETAVTTAHSFGLDGYYGVAPAFAVRARTDEAARGSDLQHALELARRAATDLGLAYVLTTCGDTLLGLGDDAGQPLLAEARTMVDRCVDPGIVGRYLSRTESRHRLAPPTAPPRGALVEQLTERELAVLRYLPSSLSQREISSELYVSLNTVKTHCSAIYRKLGVGDRKAAVQAARDLGQL